MEAIFNRGDRVYDVISEDEVLQGQEIEWKQGVGIKPVSTQVIAVLEQRKEKGRYADESKRRFWAKVKV